MHRQCWNAKCSFLVQCLWGESHLVKSPSPSISSLSLMAWLCCFKSKLWHCVLLLGFLQQAVLLLKACWEPIAASDFSSNTRTSCQDPLLIYVGFILASREREKSSRKHIHSQILGWQRVCVPLSTLLRHLLECWDPTQCRGQSGCAWSHHSRIYQYIGQTQRMAGNCSVPLQNRFGDPLWRLQPQMTRLKMENESVSLSRHSLQNISRKHDEVCLFGRV